MSPTSRPIPRRLRALAAGLLLILATLALAACGTAGDDEKAAAGAGAATVAPAGAIAYGEVLVRPGGDVEKGVSTALRRILRVEDPGAELRRLLDEETEDGDRNLYTRGFEPWLGDTIGGFLIDGGTGEDPDGAVVAAIRDRVAAEAWLAQLRRDGDLRRGGTYEGVAYDLDSEEDAAPIAIVGDFMVGGTMEGFRAAVVASKGRSLADGDAFRAAVDRVPGDRLAWAYLDGDSLKTVLERQKRVDPELARALDSADLGRLGTAVASLTARADQVVLEVEGGSGGQPDPESGAVSVQDLPGDSWMALALPSVQAQLDRALGGVAEYRRALGEIRAMAGIDLERDLFGWLGGIGLFVRGTAPLDIGGGVVLGSSDQKASERFVSRLERIAGSTGIPTAPTTGEGTGFQLKIPALPQPIVVLAKGDRVAVALGLASARDAVDPPESFGDGEPGKSVVGSLGDGYRPGFVLVVDPLVSLLTNFGLDGDADFQSALPYLSAYRSLAIGTKQADGRTAVKVVVALQQPDADRGGTATQTASR